MSNTRRMHDDDELWRDFERSDLADFIRPSGSTEPTVDLTFPEHLDFTPEQRAFVTRFVSHVVRDLTYELSHKWARHMIDILVAGEWRMPDDVDNATGPGPLDSTSSSSTD